MLAEGQQSLAKSLFLGGVTRRFPAMNFAFLEGGVAWAASLYCDLIGHWEKRNLERAARNLDPALVDRDAHGRDDGAVRPRCPPTRPRASTRRPAEPEDMLDEWAACGIEQAEDIKDAVRRSASTSAARPTTRSRRWPSTPRSTRSAPSSTP